MKFNLLFLLAIFINSILYVNGGPASGVLACAACCGIANSPRLLIPGAGWAIAAGSAGACFWQACTVSGIPLTPKAAACKAIFAGFYIAPSV